MDNGDYTKYYDLGDYIFSEVHDRFHRQRFIDAFDFFCIIIWKANRAKSKIAIKLKEKFPGKSLNDIAKKISNGIFQAPTKKEKIKNLLEDGLFRLPIASAILSVFYPNEFTIFDYRVCQHPELRKYRYLSSCKLDRTIDGYIEFIETIKKLPIPGQSFRDKDKYLWSKSFCEDLEKDIKNEFSKK